MKFSEFNEEELTLIKQCLSAAADGPFFEDWEFQTLFGIERDDLSKVSREFPNINETDEICVLAINNSMLNLIGFPHGKQKQWKEYIDAPAMKIENLYEKWKNSSHNNQINQGRS